MERNLISRSITINIYLNTAVYININVDRDILIWAYIITKITFYYYYISIDWINEFRTVAKWKKKRKSMKNQIHTL